MTLNDAVLFAPIALLIAITPGPNNFCAMNKTIMTTMKSEEVVNTSSTTMKRIMIIRIITIQAILPTIITSLAK